MHKLIIVDIQPAYEKFLDFNMNKFINWINGYGFDDIYCLYNGAELGYDDNDYIINNWYLEWGLDGYININFFEKNYGWFRDFLDSFLEEDDIINIGRYMIEHDIYDSRDFKEKDIELLKNKNINTIYLNSDSRTMFIPKLKNYFSNNIYTEDNITICGGGVDECYKEVLLLLDMLKFEYNEKIKYIY